MIMGKWRFLDKKWVVNNSELQRVPVDTTTLDLESALKVMKLIDKMEEDDDVNAVYHNLEITEKINKHYLILLISIQNSYFFLGNEESKEFSIFFKLNLLLNNPLYSFFSSSKGGPLVSNSLLKSNPIIFPIFF